MHDAITRIGEIGCAPPQVQQPSLDVFISARDRPSRLGWGIPACLGSDESLADAHLTIILQVLQQAHLKVANHEIGRLVVIMQIRTVAIRGLTSIAESWPALLQQDRVLKIALRDSYNVIGLN